MRSLPRIISSHKTLFVLQAFQDPHVTHFLLRDCNRIWERKTTMMTFMTPFQTLESIVVETQEPRVRPNDRGRPTEAFVHHGCDLKLLYFTCTRSGLWITVVREAAVDCQQLRQLALVLKAKGIVGSCKYLLERLPQLVKLNVQHDVECGMIQLHNWIEEPLHYQAYTQKLAQSRSPRRALAVGVVIADLRQRGHVLRDLRSLWKRAIRARACGSYYSSSPMLPSTTPHGHQVRDSNCSTVRARQNTLCTIAPYLTILSNNAQHSSIRIPLHARYLFRGLCGNYSSPIRRSLYP